MVKKKSVLFICPNFFKYNKMIKKQFQSKGFEVDLIRDRFDFLYSLEHFLNKKAKFGLYFQLYNKMLQHRIKNKKYDVFFVIRGESIDENTIKKIISNNLAPNAETIYYTWDSIENYPRALEISKWFSYKHSFDDCDAKKMNFIFTPLFFDESIQSGNSSIKKYDISVIASFTFERYHICKSLSQMGFRVYCKLYIKFFQFLKLFFSDKRIRKVNLTNIVFFTKSKKTISRIYMKSKSVLDLPSPKQTGISMRTIECIGLKAKEITTNKFVETYDFYRKNNIFILNDNFQEISDWLSVEYEDIDSSIFERYRIQNWLREIIHE